MSKRFKFNVLLSGYQNFNDVFAAQGSRIYNGFSRLVIPKPLPMPRPDCKYYQQDYVKRTTRDLVRLVLSEPLKNATLTHKISHGPLTANWLTTVHTNSTASQGFGCPWRTGYSYYYEVENPRCPPASPKIGAKCGKKEKKAVCPKCGCSVPICDCGRKHKPNPCESNPCNRKCAFTVPVKLCRYYTKGCGSRGDGKKSGEDKPKPCASKKGGGGGCAAKKSSDDGPKPCASKTKPKCGN